MLDNVYSRNPVERVNSILITSVINAFKVKTLFEVNRPQNRLEKDNATGAIVELFVPELLASWADNDVSNSVFSGA